MELSNFDPSLPMFVLCGFRHLEHGEDCSCRSETNIPAFGTVSNESCCIHSSLLCQKEVAQLGLIHIDEFLSDIQPLSLLNPGHVEARLS